MEPWDHQAQVRASNGFTVYCHPPGMRGVLFSLFKVQLAPNGHCCFHPSPPPSWSLVCGQLTPASPGQTLQLFCREEKRRGEGREENKGGERRGRERGEIREEERKGRLAKGLEGDCCDKEGISGLTDGLAPQLGSGRNLQEREIGPSHPGTSKAWLRVPHTGPILEA